jgi:hypothetical protein
MRGQALLASGCDNGQLQTILSWGIMILVLDLMVAQPPWSDLEFHGAENMDGW